MNEELKRIADALEKIADRLSLVEHRPSTAAMSVWPRVDGLSFRAQKCIWRLAKKHCLKKYADLGLLKSSSLTDVAGVGETTYAEIVRWMRANDLSFLDGTPDW